MNDNDKYIFYGRSQINTKRKTNEADILIVHYKTEQMRKSMARF